MKRINFRIQSFKCCITCAHVDAVQDKDNLYYAVCGIDGEEIDGAGICDLWIQGGDNEKSN